MADLYNHYNGVDPGSITSATQSLRSKVKTAQTKLSSFKSSLSDGVWKANAKETLFTAFETLDTEVYKEILDKLSKADEVASNISKYNTAKSNAEIYLSNIRGANKDTPQSTVDSWRSSQQAEEQKMRDAIATINGLL
ncbi:MAG: hypothetical protein II625_02715 [Bacilli bacterium]|nr:hypothetical protein [Bacilli bacterium]